MGTVPGAAGKGGGSGMKIIGITGPTGAGKTTALGAVTALGGRVIDCDAVYHALLARDAGLVGELTDRFGRSILDGDGGVDRKKLGGMVFRDENALAELNAVTHRRVAAEVDRLLDLARAEGRPLAAIDAIALIESGLAARCDAVVGILAPAELRVGRILAREGVTEAYARARVAAQREDAYFRAHCTHILENGPADTPDTFRAKAERLFRQMADKR